MKYQVSEEPRKFIFIWFGIITCIFFGIFVPIMIIITEGIKNNIPIIVLSFLFWLIILSGFLILFYSLRRPRIKVTGETLICYPRWRKKETIELWEITGRKTGLFADEYSSTLAGAFGFYVGNSEILTQITYSVKDRPVITIHTGMKNAKKLDSVIRKRLDWSER